MTDRSQRPPIRELTDINFPEITEKRLDNGIPIYMYERKSIDIVRLSVVTPGGMAESRNPAIALMGCLLNQEGTINRSGKEIADGLELSGAWTQAVPKSHHRILTTICMESQIRKVFPIIEDVVINPLFPDKEFESLRSRLIIQAKTSEETVGWQAETINDEMTFGKNHPYSRKCDSEAIRSVRVEEIRNFYYNNLSPEGIKIFLTGKISESIIDELNKSFGTIKSTKSYSHEKTPLFHPVTAPKTESKRMAGKIQSAVSGSIPITKIESGDVLPLRMAVFALGGYFGSRLSQNIREEKGLTYGISAVMKRYEPGYAVRIQTECANEFVEEIINEIGNELERIANEPATQEEIERIRRAEITNLSEIVSTPFSIMDFFSNIILNNLKQDYFQDRLKSALEICPEQITEISRRYLKRENLLIAIAGDIRNKD